MRNTNTESRLKKKKPSFSDCTSVPRLQRSIHVSHGVRHDDLSIRIHVSRDTLVTYMYELRRTITARPDAFRDRDTRVVPAVQEEL